MVQIIARNGKNGTVNLYVRLKKKDVINNAITLGVTLCNEDWKSVESILKSAILSQKNGGAVFIRDALAMNLWTIKNGLDVMLENDSFSILLARNFVNSVLHDNLNIDAEAESDSLHNDVPVEKRMTLMEWIKEYIRQCETGERLKQRSTKRISPGTIKSTKGTLSQLQEYERVRHCRLDFDDMTLDFYDDLKRFFLKKSYSPNTIGRHVKNLKTILFAAEDMKLTTTTDFKSSRFSVDHEDVDNVYVTEERLDEMEALDMSDYREMKKRAELYAKDEEERKSLVHALKREVYRKNLTEARDIFLVGCLTGQRVSDYKRIDSNMIETLRDGRQYIRITQTKTGKEVFLPLDERVPRILGKYDGHLPKIYDQHLNDRIKVVGLLLGWTEPAGMTEHRGTMRYKSSKRFCDALKTHTARRTFATNAHKAGVSLSSIMAVTGHSSEAMLRKYLKLDNQERAILAATEFERRKKSN